MKFIKALVIGCMVLAAPFKVQALELSQQTDNVDVNLISSFEEINPNQNIEFIIRFEMKNGWHIFAQNPGEIGMPTQVEWELPHGYEILETSWSKDKPFDNDGIVQYGYGDVAYYKTTIRPHPETTDTALIKSKIKWLACQEDCMPGHAEFEFNLPITQRDLLPSPQWNTELAAAQRWFYPESGQPIYWGTVLIMAFLGGLILNFMPCILPVLTIKAISLAQSSFERQKNCMEALFYSIGVILSFLIVATILLILRLNGEYVGWGFQLQSPIFVGIMIIIFAIISLMFLGIITFNNPLADAIGRMSFKNHLISSFMTGFLAVLIASPCTAPFMGIAIGYTLTAPIITYYPVFLMLGLGYALPFALIHIYPKVIRKILPKPGKWMDILKKIFAIPVILTCIWLSHILYIQLNHSDKATENLDWHPYEEQIVNQLVKDNKPVFIDFTAQWCLTCLLNKKSSLQSEEFEKLVNSRGIHLYRADWTSNDEHIAKALAKYGRNSIPLYVYYDGKSDDYLILPQLLTPAILKEYLQ